MNFWFQRTLVRLGHHYRTLSLLLGLLGSGCFGSDFLQAQSVSVLPKLRTIVVVRRDFVTIGELFEHAPGSLAHVPLFRSPDPGNSGKVHSDRVIQSAQAAGITAFSANPPPVVTVVRNNSRASSEALKGILEPELRTALLLSGRDRITIKITNAMSDDVYTLAQTDVLEVVSTGLEKNGQFAAHLRIKPERTTDEPQVRTAASFTVLGQVTLFSPILRLSNPVSRGVSLSKEDLVVNWIERKNIPNDALTQLSDAVENVMRFPARVGTILRRSMVQAPRLVARNQPVAIQYISARLSLMVKGLALQDGAKGDLITVRNGRSNHTFRAQVVGSGKVRVQ